MSNKTSLSLVLALAAMTAQASPDPSLETVDQYARRHLDAQHEVKNDDVCLELVFTQGEGKKRSAYLLIEERYGKDVYVGDSIRGWKVQKIGSDHIDITKGNRRERLLLTTEIKVGRPARGHQ
jgi:hypothetical protein